MSTKKNATHETSKPWATSTPCGTHSEKANTSQPCSNRSTKTRITIKYDVGFSNSLYLRGDGPDLNWNRGIKLKNVKADEWVWETDRPFKQGEFKVLVNDTHFEKGENHKLIAGANVVYTPSF